MKPKIGAAAAKRETIFRPSAYAMLGATICCHLQQIESNFLHCKYGR
jgi:hypothetical protein